MDSTPNGRLLVLVDVKWTSWRGRIHSPGTADPSRQHKEFLQSLLCADAKPKNPTDFDAWILHDPAGDELDALIHAAGADEAAAAKAILEMSAARERRRVGDS